MPRCAAELRVPTMGSFVPRQRWCCAVSTHVRTQHVAQAAFSTLGSRARSEAGKRQARRPVTAARRGQPRHGQPRHGQPQRGCIALGSGPLGMALQPAPATRADRAGEGRDSALPHGAAPRRCPTTLPHDAAPSTRPGRRGQRPSLLNAPCLSAGVWCRVRWRRSSWHPPHGRPRRRSQRGCAALGPGRLGTAGQTAPGTRADRTSEGWRGVGTRRCPTALDRGAGAPRWTTALPRRAGPPCWSLDTPGRRGQRHRWSTLRAGRRACGAVSAGGDHRGIRLTAHHGAADHSAGALRWGRSGCKWPDRRRRGRGLTGLARVGTRRWTTTLPRRWRTALACRAAP